MGGLPATMHLQLVEPLRELFKDEVRVLGVALGIDPESVWRHPFPGPGLAIRLDSVFVIATCQYKSIRWSSIKIAVNVPIVDFCL